MMHLSTVGTKLALAAFALSAGFAGAQERPEGYVIGKPEQGAETGFQPAVTVIAEDIHWMDDLLLIIIAAISLFVVALIGWVIFRYHESRNPTPARFSHNAVIEVIWTAVPVLILIIIAIPSLRLLFLQLDIPEPELTIKATGYQWYWSYEYPDEGISFDAFMLERDQLEEYGYEPDEYLLATDTRVVVPIDTDVVVLTTGADVIHNWMVPAFGVKQDSIPGRVNETWFNVRTPGLYFGQCSELCGKNHAYMPIVVEAMEQADYEAWKEEQLARQNGDTDFAEAPAR